MNKEFLIVKNMKLFILSLEDIILIIPNRDRILKDRLYNTSYDILYNLYKCNYSKDKVLYYDILSSINTLDFYLEVCLKKKYITSKMCEKKSNELLKITKMVYGWIKYESKCL